MKVSLKVEQLGHNDLATLLNDCFFCNQQMSLDYEPSEYQAVPEDKRTKAMIEAAGVFLADKCADILLNGGYVYVDDYNSNLEVHGLKHIKHEIFEDDENPSVRYQLRLKDIIKGMQQQDAIGSVKDFMDGNNYFHTGYTIIQCALFGKVIYD